MANTVIALKKSSTPAAAPADLANGELAINFADGKLFYKNTAGYIAEISGGAGGGNAFATVNANGTLVVADTTGDVFTLIPGTNIQIVGDAINDTITISASGGSMDYPYVNTATQAANSWANTKLANSTVTLNGDLTVNGNVIVMSNDYFGYANTTLTVKFYTFYNVTSNSIDTVFNA